MTQPLPPIIRETLQLGVAIPAHPLALTSDRRLDERRQRALSRYYLAAGAGGLAVGVHTTQFAIREPRYGLFQPVLELAREELDRADSQRTTPAVRIGGICGFTAQAVREAELLGDLGYHCGLLSLAALKTATDDELLAHCREVGDVLPLMGFYLQPAVGGRILNYSFWRRFAELESLVAIKLAPFNRYQTLDVIRAVVDAGRDDIALYTGNDDNILLDLVAPFRFIRNGQPVDRRIVGGLLGHWAVWTQQAVAQLNAAHDIVRTGGTTSADWLALAQQVTDANAVVFDASNGFAGCIAGIHEVLRRQGLLENLVFLDPAEKLSPGQAAELDRICQAYPHLLDDEFVVSHREEWLR